LIELFTKRRSFCDFN